MIPPAPADHRTSAAPHHLCARPRNRERGLAILAIAFVLATIAGSDLASAATVNFSRVSPVTDGAGGAIFVWSDARTGDSNIYAARVLADGTVSWFPNGMPVCLAAGEQDVATALADGQRGAFVLCTRAVLSGTDVYVQHIDSLGVAHWGPNGVRACALVGTTESPQMIADGFGGVIVAWQDSRAGADIYAQRIDASGALVWNPNGVAICTASGSQYEPDLASDGAGGAIVAWSDFRSGGDVYAQRVDVSGTPMWTANGVPVVATGDIENSSTLLPDGSAGAFVVGADFSNAQLRIQRLDANGAAQWGAGGVSPCTVAYSATSSTVYVTPDLAGGMLIAWEDATRGGAYAQDMVSDGTLGWGAAGRHFVGVGGPYFAAQPDGAGGLVLGSQHDVDQLNAFAKAGIQRVNAAGSSLWGASGIELPVTTVYQDLPLPVADGTGGAIYFWGDRNRSCGMHPPCSVGGVIHEYARRVDGSGNAVWQTIVLSSGTALSIGSEAATTLRLDVVGANPSVQGAKLRFELPLHAKVRLGLYDLAGRLVARLVDDEMPAGEHTVTWDTRRADHSGAAGIYFAQMQVGSTRVTRRIVVLE